MSSVEELQAKLAKIEAERDQARSRAIALSSRIAS